MYDFLNFISFFLRLELFAGFGFYSILYFIIKPFLKKKRNLIEFDKSGLKLVINFGIIWFILWLIITTTFYFSLHGIERQEYSEQLFGKYAIYFWGQALFWFLLTQTYRFNTWSRFLIFRLITSILLVVNFEKIIIMITSIHRDYLPSNWTMDSSYITCYSSSYLILNLILKTITVTLFIAAYHYCRKKLRFTTLYKKT